MGNSVTNTKSVKNIPKIVKIKMNVNTKIEKKYMESLKYNKVCET